MVPSINMTVFWGVVPYSLEETNVPEVLAASVIRAHCPEMSVNFYHTTWCNIPHDSHLHMLSVCSIITDISHPYLLTVPELTQNTIIVLLRNSLWVTACRLDKCFQ
jgi:hypothetical protein